MSKYFSGKLLLVGSIAVGSWACSVQEPAFSPYESGTLFLNAGNFTDNNGTISFLPRNAKTIDADIFSVANQRSITGSVQHYTEVDGKGIILVDNSTAGQDKAEIVEGNTFKSLATLKAPDIENPRYVIRVSPNKAYVSCWGTTGDFSNFYPNPGYIAVINLASNTITKTIPIAKGAEKMVLSGNEVFVGNVGGDRSLVVIDVTKDEVKQRIDIGTNVSPVALDANNQLWVYTTKEMIRIDPSTKVIGTRLKVGTHPSKEPNFITISSDKQSFYFVYSFYDPADGYKQKGETYKFSISDTSIPATKPFVSRLFTGLGVDPQTGNLYAGSTPSFKQAGYVIRYKPDGTVIDSVKAEIAPSGFFFK